MSSDYRVHLISQKIAELMSQLDDSVDVETGEIIDKPEIWDQLAELVEKRKSYIEDIVKEVQNRQHLANGLREQELALAKRRRQHEGVIERLKGFLLNLAKQEGGKMEIGMYRLGVRRSKRVEVVDMDALPEQIDGVPLVKVERKPIKSAIMKIWKSGKAVLGTKIVENEGVNIKIK